MHSATRVTQVNSSPGPASCLFAALNELLRGVDGRVVLLRPLTATFDSQHDDIDLLLTEPQREQLFLSTFIHSMRGQIHCRILQSSAAKAQLILWTIDCSQKLMIDLWTSFDQLPRHRHSCIPADRLLNAMTAAVPGRNADPSEMDCADPEIPALRQLPPDIDLCLLIQHLAAKRRKLTSSTERVRMVFACDRLASWSPEQTVQQVPCHLRSALRDMADQLPRATILTPKSVALSGEYLLRRLAGVQNNRGLPILERRSRRGLITGLRKAVLRHRPTVAVIGSDGAGKSSLVVTLASQQPQTTAAVAKKLYRRSLTYLILSGLMKRFFGTDRGSFDDHIAPLITMRAAAAAWIGMCLTLNPWSNPKQSSSDRKFRIAGRELTRTSLLDRSIASFLIKERKSDTPTMTRAATWIESLVPPVTSVLLTLPHSELTRRKQEMSAPGHNIYQRLLFQQALRQQPTDVILLANLPSAEAAATAICELLLAEIRTVESSTESAEHGKVAA